MTGSKVKVKVTEVRNCENGRFSVSISSASMHVIVIKGLMMIVILQDDI